MVTKLLRVDGDHINCWTDSHIKLPNLNNKLISMSKFQLFTQDSAIAQEAQPF